MRGMFTAGVMDVMMTAGIRFDGAIGVSAGAAFGVNYKSGQVGRVLRYNTRFCADPRYSGWGVFLREGNLFSTPFCYEEVPLVHDVFDFDSYEKDPMEFYVVATDVETGRPVYHRYDGRKDHGFEWIRASASMPLVSQMVEIDGVKMLDGGISDSIPIRYFESIGYHRNVVILTQPKGYIKGKNPMVPLAKVKYRRYPNLIRAMAERHLGYNATLAYIDRLEQAGEVLVIRPEQALEISKAEKDPRKLKAVYDLGRKAAQARLAEIQGYLKGEKQ